MLSGKQFERDIEKSFLRALWYYDSSSRKSTRTEDKERGADFYSQGIPIDVTIKPKKKGNQTNKVELLKITIDDKNFVDIPIMSYVRYDNNYVKHDSPVKPFDIPTLVIEFAFSMNIDGGYDQIVLNTYDLLVEETLFIKNPKNKYTCIKKNPAFLEWKKIIDAGVEYYCKITGYDAIDDVMNRELKIQKDIRCDIISKKEKYNKKLWNHYAIPDCTGGSDNRGCSMANEPCNNCGACKPYEPTI